MESSYIMNLLLHSVTPQRKFDYIKKELKNIVEESKEQIRKENTTLPTKTQD